MTAATNASSLPNGIVSTKDWAQRCKMEKAMVHMEIRNTNDAVDSSVFDDAEDDDSPIPSIEHVVRFALLKTPNISSVAVPKSYQTLNNYWRHGTPRTISGRLSRWHSRDKVELLLGRSEKLDAVLPLRPLGRVSPNATVTAPTFTTTTTPRQRLPTATPNINNNSTKQTTNVQFLEEKDIKDTDVLCGRGGKSNLHPGNKRYRHVIGELRREYRGTCVKTVKTALSRAIVDHVNEYGGRFLKFSHAAGCWEILSKGDARRKTAQALRETKVYISVKKNE